MGFEAIVGSRNSYNTVDSWLLLQQVGPPKWHLDRAASLGIIDVDCYESYHIGSVNLNQMCESPQIHSAYGSKSDDDSGSAIIGSILEKNVTESELKAAKSVTPIHQS